MYRRRNLITIQSAASGASGRASRTLRHSTAPPSARVALCEFVIYTFADERAVPSDSFSAQQPSPMSREGHSLAGTGAASASIARWEQSTSRLSPSPSFPLSRELYACVYACACVRAGRCVCVQQRSRPHIEITASKTTNAVKLHGGYTGALTSMPRAARRRNSLPLPLVWRQPLPVSSTHAESAIIAGRGEARQEARGTHLTHPGRSATR